MTGPRRLRYAGLLQKLRESNQLFVFLVLVDVLGFLASARIRVWPLSECRRGHGPRAPQASLLRPVGVKFCGVRSGSPFVAAGASSLFFLSSVQVCRPSERTLAVVLAARAARDPVVPGPGRRWCSCHLVQALDSVAGGAPWPRKLDGSSARARQRACGARVSGSRGSRGPLGSDPVHCRRRSGLAA